MAVRTPTVTKINENCTKFTYTGLLQSSADTGSPIGPQWWDFSDRSFQVTGTFGVGGNLRWAGSNDETNYVALNDPFGVALNITAAGLKGVTEAAILQRPEVTAGDGTTTLVVTVFARRPPKII